MTPWRLVSSEQIVSSQWLNVERNSYDTASGSRIGEYYIVRRQAFVLVIAECNKSVVLVRQYRPATEKTYLSVPAGYIEAEEDPISTARRELWEETGSEATNAAVVGSLDPLPGYINSPAKIVYCRCHGSTFKSKADSETIVVECRTWPEVLEMILLGEIDEMQAVAALFLVKEWLARNPQ